METDLCPTLSDQEVEIGLWMLTLHIQSRPSSLATGSTAVEQSLSGELLLREVVVSILIISLTPSLFKHGDPHQSTLMAATACMVGSNLFSPIPLADDGGADRGMVNGTVPESERIEVQPGDVVGYYLESRMNDRDGIQYAGDDDNDPDYTNETVWYIIGIMAIVLAHQNVQPKSVQTGHSVPPLTVHPSSLSHWVSLSVTNTFHAVECHCLLYSFKGLSIGTTNLHTTVTDRVTITHTLTQVLHALTPVTCPHKCGNNLPRICP